MEANSHFALTVRRCDPAVEEGPCWQTYQVPVFDHMSVLDALFWVQRNSDPTLSFRCACRVGMCGSCGMIINGTEGLACRTLVSTIKKSEARLEPMRTLPVLKDLVTDMGPFFEKYRKVMPNFVPSGDYQDLSPIPPGSKLRGVIDQQRECISCGLCLSACSVAAMDETFLGPAALNRAYCLIADPREGAQAERLDLIAHESGLWRCHTLFNCAQVCPKGIIPTQSIQLLKRKVVVSRFQKLFMFWRRRRKASGRGKS